jgi:selenocysteine-specific elongation factor
MIIGTAGHIDHGKTSLVRALTGVDTDRLKEEKVRGISIDLGFAYLPSPHGSVLGFVDVPGHERFVHNMLAGATGIDFVLLAIAADDGVMQQTVEHLDIVELLGIEHGIVALTKSDLADEFRRDGVRADITRLLAPTRLAGSEIIPVSVLTGEGIPELRDSLFQAGNAHRQRRASGRFRLAVDRCFTLAGAGTVVTGTVLSGAVSVGDRVIISPSGLAARVRSIHAQNRAAEQGRAGERCALNLAGEGIGKDAIERGDIVLDPALHAPTARIDAELRLLSTERKPVGQWMPVRLHHTAAEIGARIVLLGDEPVPPGGEARVQLVLDKPIAAAVGDRFVVRDTTAQRTIGGGSFLDLRAPARKRRVPERLAQLDACAIADSQKALAALLSSPPHFVDLIAFARDRTLAESEIEAITEHLAIKRIVTPTTSFALSAPGWLRFKQSLIATLAAFHLGNPDLPGLGIERLRLQIEPRLVVPAFLSALQDLARAHEVALDGAWVRLPGHQVKLTPQDEDIWYEIQPLLSAADRFRPPRVRDICAMLSITESEVRRLMKLLGRMGRLDEVAHDHFFLRETMAEIVAIIVDIVEQEPGVEFSATQLRDRLDNGRKVAIQILEFLDRHGVTLRHGDLRRINKHRIDLFGRPPDKAVKPEQDDHGRESSLVGRPDFKSGRGRESAFGGFDSHSLPPHFQGARR